MSLNFLVLDRISSIPFIPINIAEVKCWEPNK